MKKKLPIWRKLLVCGIAMSIVVAGGCSKERMQEEEKEKDGFTVSVFTDGEKPAPDNKIFKKIEDELGVKFEFITYKGEGSNEEKALAASGDYPDVLTFSERIIDRGGAIPLEDMLPDYPNLYKHYEPYLERMTDEDGHIYNLPDYGIMQGKELVKSNWMSGFFIQKAVLAEFGYPKITTLDEYFTLIELYKERYPELNGKPTIGYTICNDGTDNYGLVNPPALLSGYPNNANCIVNPDTDVAEDFRTKEMSERFYRKLCEEYEKGIIDPEACLISKEQYLERLSQGNVLGFADETWNINEANVNLGKSGMSERTYLNLPLIYEAGIREQYMDYQQVSGTSGFMISVNCKEPESVLQLFDTLLEEKWQKLFTWGVEGEEYLVDESGMFYRTGEMRIEQYQKDWNYKNTGEPLFNHLPKIEGVYSDGNATNMGAQPREFRETLNDYDRELLNRYGMNCWGDFFLEAEEQPPYFPTWRFSPPDGSLAQNASANAAACNSSWLPRLITCGTNHFDEMWQQYCAAYEQTGYEIFIAYINECIQKSLSR